VERLILEILVLACVMLAGMSIGMGIISRETLKVLKAYQEKVEREKKAEGISIRCNAFLGDPRFVYAETSPEYDRASKEMKLAVLDMLQRWIPAEIVEVNGGHAAPMCIKSDGSVELYGTEEAEGE